MSGQSILRLFLPRIVVGFLVGVLYAGTWYGSPVSGSLAGALCAASFTSLERFVLRRNSGGFIRPLRFLAYFALRSVLYVGVIVFVIAVVNEAAGAGFAGVRAIDHIVALVLAAGVILFLSVNGLLGPGVLFAFVAGRYGSRSAQLLFIDMRASTAVAERLGELRYLRLLNRFVVRRRGSERRNSQICWRRGDRNMAPCARRESSGVRHRRIRRPRPDHRARPCLSARIWRRSRLPGRLHCGPVAVGELGSLRKEIALIGDTMNTAARILEACRDTDNRVLASAALIERLATLPPGVTRRRLGQLPVRGKERRLELDVLETEGSAGRHFSDEKVHQHSRERGRT
jgi:adenylate cyclase